MLNKNPQEHLRINQRKIHITQNMNSPFAFRLSDSRFSLILLTAFLSHQARLALSNTELPCHEPFRCGNLTVGFPFWGENRPVFCGHPHLELRCEKDQTTSLEIKDAHYILLKYDDISQTLTLARSAYYSIESLCFFPFFNTTLDADILEYLPGYKNLTVYYGCNVSSSSDPYSFDCKKGGIGLISTESVDYKKCRINMNFTVPEVFDAESPGNIYSRFKKVLKDGFKVKLKFDDIACQSCVSSGGLCVLEDHNKRICRSPPPPAQSLTDKKSHHKKIGIIIALTVVAVALLAGVLFLIYWKRKRTVYKSSALYTHPESSGTTTTTTTTATSLSVSRSTISMPSLNSDLGGSAYFGVHVFSYQELEEATGNFSKELGDGGFGVVYYGELRDGRAVAVKRLYENTLKRTEQFRNEIDILKTLQHPNLVTLYGCTSRHGRELLLVYEYISNGTLANHLHGNHANSHPLAWPVRLDIAIETASALAYLHESGIIHRDVKTNNILLDSHFHVKVADFGLSRLFPIDVTHVSTAPQGTPGYVDPEYHQCYQLTEKSDVYSFGVVLIELISAKEAVDITRHRHDINLANMAINRIQNQKLNELVDPFLNFESDFVVKRMVMLVAELAFRCLQQEKELRPVMEEVVETLQMIRKEAFGEEQRAEVVDICGAADDVGLLKNNFPPPISPETDKWVSGSSTSTLSSGV